MKIAVQLDRPEKLKLVNDSTLHFMQHLRSRGHEVRVYHPLDLIRSSTELKVTTLDWQLTDSFTLSDPREENLDDYNIVLIRQDPPFDEHYLTNTYLLETLQKALVFNPPQAIRSMTEKLITLNFPEFIPETIVSANADAINHAVKTWDGAILKPLYGCSGNGIIKIDNENLNELTTIVANHIKSYGTILAQKIVAGAENGDKRVLIIDGKVLGAIHRKPKLGEFRANMAQGGSVELGDLNPKELAMCQKIANFLQGNGIIIAGLDIMQEHLLEINITSPTCFKTYDDLTKGSEMAESFAKALEQRYQQLRRN